MITVEFFDVGCSRRVAWEQRPHAAALLEQARAVDCAFDAVVVGEFERAFTDRQFEHVAGVWRSGGSRCGYRRQVGRCGWRTRGTPC